MLAHVDPTETTLGPVAGRRQEAWPGGPEVDVFRGIPYAEAPVGPRRFRPPEPQPPWRRVLDAGWFGPAAPQPDSDPLGAPIPRLHADRWDESCLTLNVWAPVGPAVGAARPVLVWIHGGAFTIGSSGLPVYDAARLCAESGAVVVSLNYRLGALGFLLPPADAEGDLTANCGLADQVLALRWVRDNADRFGGDPSLVTVFGESAGAGSILHLLAWPEAAGLFRRAILQSPGVSQLLDRSRAATVRDRLCGHLGVSGSPAELRAVPVAALLDAQRDTAAEVAASVGSMPFHPVSGAGGVPADPVAALGQGAARDVDVVVGTTEEEMRLFWSPALDGLDHDHLVGVLRPVVSRVLGADAPVPVVSDLVSAYRGWAGAGGAGAVWAAVMTDGLMRLPAEAALEAHAGGPGRSLSYSFAWRPTGPARPYGAFHSVDLPFTFGTFDRDGWGEFLGAGSAAERLGRSLRRAWAAFAAEGAVPGWPAWTAAERPTMIFGPETAVVADPLAGRREAWRAAEKETR